MAQKQPQRWSTETEKSALYFCLVPLVSVSYVPFAGILSITSITLGVMGCATGRKKDYESPRELF